MSTKVVVKPDITTKSGYQPYRKDWAWQRDLVGVRIPIFPNDGEMEIVAAGIDGVHYHIPRGSNWRVPRAIVEMLNTREQHQWAMPAKHPHQGLVYVGKQPRFYVIELGAKEAAEAPALNPMAPIGAEQRQQLSAQQLAAVQEDAQAKRDIASAPVHPDLAKARFGE